MPVAADHVSWSTASPHSMERADEYVDLLRTTMGHAATASAHRARPA